MNISVHSEDNRFQHLEVIKRNREKRNRYGKFFVEGVSSLNLALAHGWKFDTIAYAAGARLSDWAKSLIARAKPETVLELAPHLMDKLSDREERSELIALLKMRSIGLSDITAGPSGLLVVCDRAASPGNLGSSIRTADAFGADGLAVSGHAVDPYEPAVSRSSVGTLFALPVAKIASPQEVVEWVSAARSSGNAYTVVGTSAQGDRSMLDATLQGPIVVLMGNETTGLSKAYKEIADLMLRIPITGTASSLNVSSALAIVLYEIRRQRAARGEP